MSDVSHIVNVIDRACAIAFGVSVDDLRNSRRRPATLAKFCAMYLVEKQLRLSNVQIGKEYGRDPTSVIYALNTIRSLYVRSQGIKERCDKAELGAFVAQHTRGRNADAMH